MRGQPTEDPNSTNTDTCWNEEWNPEFLIIRHDSPQSVLSQERTQPGQPFPFGSSFTSARMMKTLDCVESMTLKEMLTT